MLGVFAGAAMVGFCFGVCLGGVAMLPLGGRILHIRRESHSWSIFYASGLSPHRVRRLTEEVAQ